MSMLLSDLLKDVVTVPTSKDMQITGISEYSADVISGDLFIATSGLQYSADAIANGAVAIICESHGEVETLRMDSTIPMFPCNNLAGFVGDIAARFYGEINADIKTIAVTGTDGKSSVAHLVAQALEQSDQRCGLIGTLGYGRLANLSEATHTTPPIARIAREYFKFNEMGCTAVAMEASSHGIQQGRLSNVPIHTAVLTNITRDHLDYHKSVEDYIQAKAGLFFTHQPENAVINLDDAIGRQWCEQLDSLVAVITFSLGNVEADVYAIDVQYLQNATMMKLSIKGKETHVHVPLLGEFNVLNVLAVAAILLSLGKNHQQIEQALNKLDAVPGRMQRVSVQKGTVAVVVDYAHTPAALFAALNAVREHCVGKLICVFGCGGNRDAGKRSQMGKIASRYSDHAVITSDNPRNEKPQDIIDEIISGCVNKDSYTVIVDRKQAIEYALQMASANDAVLIAGKGHEKYQYIKDQKLAFDDVEIAAKQLARLAHG